jgi:hypothetical protein
MINDLEKNIYHVLDASEDHEPNEVKAAHYAMNIGGELAKATRPRSQEREMGKLWASDLGETCLRKAWYKFHATGEMLPLMGHTKFKFLYGNLLEEATLYLAEEAGHYVCGTQDRVEWDVPNTDWVVSGRIDAIIDDALIDVKSTSSYGYKKYASMGLNHSNDTFGYLWQLSFYHHHYKGKYIFSPDQTGFVWIDKQNGHILYDNVSSKLWSKEEIATKVDTLVKTIEKPKPTDFRMAEVPDGKSGNMKLNTKCSYCDFREHCWKDSNGGKGLRTFLYGNGPVYLTDVKREPKVPEIAPNA